MKKIDYEKVTIENIQNLNNSGYITEIIFDADSRTINIKEAEYLEIENAFKKLEESIKPIVNAIYDLGEKMSQAFNSIFKDIKHLLNKKITKKRFIKLLQSQGIQRNKINEIIKNNKEIYTYYRYYNILQKF